MVSWIDRKEEYQTFARSIDPACKLCVKEESWLMIVASWALFLISFGKFKREKFMQGYGTTIGPWQYYSRTMPALSKRFLAHESYHVRQFRKLGLWIHPIAGIPANIILYGLIFFPIYFAYGRYMIEMNAERFALKYYLDDGATDEQVRGRYVHFAEMITSYNYLCCWPRALAVSKANKRSTELIDEWKRSREQCGTIGNRT